MDFNDNEKTRFDEEHKSLNKNTRQKIPHSNSMATASLICSIISITTICCFYFSLPLAGMAVILGLLSKGGEDKFNLKSLWGIILGFISLAGCSFIAILALTILNPYNDMDPSNPFYELHQEFKEEYDNIYNEYYDESL